MGVLGSYYVVARVFRIISNMLLSGNSGILVGC